MMKLSGNHGTEQEDAVMTSEVLRVLNMKFTAFWDMTTLYHTPRRLKLSK
jgi:hypothetical protein